MGKRTYKGDAFAVNRQAARVIALMNTIIATVYQRCEMCRRYAFRYM